MDACSQQYVFMHVCCMLYPYNMSDEPISRALCFKAANPQSRLGTDMPNCKWTPHHHQQAQQVMRPAGTALLAEPAGEDGVKICAGALCCI